jgi:hypothetical protein
VRRGTQIALAVTTCAVALLAATAGEAAAACPNESSRVGASSRLPDCRVYEFVTPGLNNSAPAGGLSGLIVEAVRADGNALAFQATDASSAAEGSTATTNTLLAARGAAGWSTRSLSAPTPLASGTDFGADRSTVGISADLTQSVLWSNQPLAGGASPGGTNLYLRRANGIFLPLTTVGAPTFSAGGELAGASQDFTRLFIVSTVKQLGTDPVAGGNTYEWSNGSLHLVAILPGVTEEPAPEGGGLPHGALPALSDDGSQVLFKAVGLPGLYLRSDASHSVEASASERAVPDPNPPADAVAAGLAADGSEVLFTSASELTEDANTGETGGVPNDQGSDLYSYDVATETLTDLTVDENPADELTGADVEQVVGASRDASYVYFVATGNLAAGGTSGERNLYVEHGGQMTFVATDPSVEPEAGHPFYVTPDGLHAAFTSTAPQSAYDNAGFDEVYEYAYGGPLQCASCRVDGEPPTADSSIAGRALSDDGARLFFQSADAVVLEAQSGETNVFEYEGGAAQLLTPGEGSSAVLLGTSASGQDVFVASFEELSPQGQGPVFAIYDARENAVVVPPASSSSGCQGETCRGVGPAAPVLAGAGSSSFEAPGKVATPEAKTAKGSKVQLRVIVPGPGELTISGRGMGSVNKQVAKEGPLLVTLALGKKADRKRRNLGIYRTEAELTFRSTAAEISRAVVALKFEASAQQSGAAKHEGSGKHGGRGK